MSELLQSKTQSSPLAKLPWLLSGVVTALAIIVWGTSLNWHFSHLSIYAIFPVIGLLAWSIMWSHYMTGFLQRTVLHDANLKTYFRWTSYVVLAAILLHPALLAYQRFRDGYGLPPHSETSYVAPGLGWIVTLGAICWLIFLAYELHRWFGTRRWWQYVVYAGDAAMFGIFYHGLRLGTQLHVEWFRYVWWFYGISLLAVLLYAYFFAAQPRFKPATKP